MRTYSSAAIFCADIAIAQMIDVLCSRVPIQVAVADGDDPVRREDGIQYAREHSVPLVLFGVSFSPIPADILGASLPRPFLFSEFLTVLHALSKGDTRPKTLQSGSVLHWDPHDRIVRVGTDYVILSPREADVFAMLYAAMPEPVSRETLQRDFNRKTGNGADVYVSYLRRKLEALPARITIQSIRGRGYALWIQSAGDENTDTTVNRSMI